MTNITMMQNLHLCTLISLTLGQNNSGADSERYQLC